MDRGFSTHATSCKSLGTDREEVVNQRAKEVREAIELAKEIEKETGEKVPWQMFAGLKPPAPSRQPDMNDNNETDDNKEKDDT